MISLLRIPVGVLPEGIDADAIAEESCQAAFGVIAEMLDAAGYPVTGDFSPSEAATLREVFVGFVHAMAVNNAELRSYAWRE